MGRDMKKQSLSAADRERHFWRFAAESPDASDSVRRFARGMVEKLDHATDEAVLKHVEARKKAAKKSKLVEYFKDPAPGMLGYFSANELNSIAQAMRESLPGVDLGGRPVGTGRLDQDKNWSEIGRYYIDALIRSGGIKARATRFTYQKYYYDSENGIPTGNELQPWTDKFERWKREIEQP